MDPSNRMLACKAWRTSSPTPTTQRSTGSIFARRPPIESTFATVRLCESATQGAGSRTAGLVMAFKLLKAAQVTGADFVDRKQMEPQPSGKRKKTATYLTSSHKC